METVSPCQSCGACCAKFRISYYWGEKVPEGYYREGNHHLYHSLIDEKDSEGRPRCKALKGELGKSVGCEIYHDRPSPCRDFKYSYEDGVHEPRCDEARASIGLKPLPVPI